MDHGGQFHQLGVVGVMVPFDLAHLAKRVHVQWQRFRDARRRGHPEFPRAQRRVRRDRDADAEPFVVVVCGDNSPATAFQARVAKWGRRVGGGQARIAAEEEGVDLGKVFSLHHHDGSRAALDPVG